MTSERIINTLSDYFRERYGERVQKIALDGGFTCPNRDGSKGEGGCAFCDGRGSLAPYCPADASIAEQVRLGVTRLSTRFNARKFVAYFQSFSGTYAPPETLRARYDEAIADPRIIGLSVATRSDCLAPEALDVVASYMERVDEVRLEFGLQTVNRAVLAAMGCGHTPEDFASATRAAHARGIKVCAHVIFGLPGDDPAWVLDSARLLNALGVEGVKIHNLFLTADSRLGREYLEAPFAMMTREDYIDAVAEFIARLRPEVVVERVAGDASCDQLIAPDWRLEKRTQWRVISDAMTRKGLRQGAKA